MASLNTLRTRGGIVVSVVIGIALIAFIVSDATLIDFITGGGNARDPKLGEIAGAKVRYSEFMGERRRLEDVTRLMTGRSATTEDYEMSNDMAWESLVMKYSYAPGFEKLGIAVSEAEMVDMTTGAYLSPVVTGTFVDPANGMFDPAILKDFIDNMARENRYENGLIWSYLKEQMGNQRVMSKYMKLITEGMFVTDMEIDAAMRAENRLSDIRVASKPYSAIADSLVNVGSAEIRNYYNDHRNAYRQTASRTIDYVVFDVLPSEADFDRAVTRADELAEAFRAAGNPVQYASLNSPDDRTPARYMRENQIDPRIAEVVIGDPEAMYGPVLDGDTYTIARLGETRMMPDSIGASHILLPASDNNLADSLLRVARQGSDFAALAREYSMDRSTSGMGGDMGTFTPESLESDLPEFTEAILVANRGDIIRVDAPYGIHIVKVDSKTAPVRKYKIAQIKYTVKPSTATQSSVIGEAQRFYTTAHRSASDFSKAVTESALTKRTAIVSNTERNIRGLDNSVEVVRWAFNNKKGAVSEPIAIGLDHYIVAVISDVKEEGFSSMEDVSASIRTALIKEKKGDMLAAEMAGKTPDQIASENGEEVKEIEQVRYAEFYIHGVGVEPKLIGAVAATDELNASSKPVIGNSGVYVFQVTNVENTGDSDPTDQRVKLEAASTSYFTERAAQAVFEASGVKDERVKYL